MEKKQKKIAIVGCGIGGATLVYYLKQKYPNISITIFEKNSKLGGRLNYIKLEDGKTIEIGAQFFNGKNYNLLKFIKENNIPYEKVEKTKARTIIFNGKEPVFDSNRYFAILRFLWRYGIWSILKLKYFINNKKKSFDNLYKKIDLDNKNENAYKNPKEFLEHTELNELVKKTGRDYFLENGYYSYYVDELMTAFLSLIYNQNIKDINGMATLIGMIGVVEDSFIFTKGGSNLIDCLVKNKKNVDVKFNSNVDKIIRNDNKNNFEVFVNGKGYDFDIVLCAAPLEQSNIKLVKIEKELKFKNCHEYKEIYVYVVRGLLNEKTFQMEEIEKTNILFCQDENSKTRGIGCITYKHTLKGEYIYSVESSRKLENKDMEIIFRKFDILKEQKWKCAYPLLKPVDSSLLPDFRVCEGFYYVNSMEQLSSCMELESISAKNIVKLLMENELRDF